MKKIFKILPLLLVASLTACNNLIEKTGTGYYFYTEVSYTFYSKNNKTKAEDEIKKICQEIDNYSDSYQKRTMTNVFDLNQTNVKTQIDKGLYELLDVAKNSRLLAKNFNPLIGSLSDKWKEALGKENPEVLSDEVIQEELAKIKNSSINLDRVKVGYDKYEYYAERTGEAQIDVGGIAKGFALDRIFEILLKYDVTDYLINCGSSSILLGKKNQSESYTVSLRDVPNTKFKAHDCVISSSGNDIQGVKIGDTMYSHIINPNTGSAIMENDAVIVITDNTLGYLGDALSTSMMMNTVEEIKEIEEDLGVKTIVVKDKKIVYNHPDIELI